MADIRTPVVITVDATEQALLLAQEHNDHPGWTTLAWKIRNAQLDSREGGAHELAVLARRLDEQAAAAEDGEGLRQAAQMAWIRAAELGLTRIGLGPEGDGK